MIRIPFIAILEKIESGKQKKHPNDIYANVWLKIPVILSNSNDKSG
jgi:hypothetical protein